MFLAKSVNKPLKLIVFLVNQVILDHHNTLIDLILALVLMAILNILQDKKLATVSLLL